MRLAVIDDPPRSVDRIAVERLYAQWPHRPDLFVRSYRNQAGTTVTVHTDLCGCTTLVQTWPDADPPPPAAFAAPSSDH